MLPPVVNAHRIQYRRDLRIFNASADTGEELSVALLSRSAILHVLIYDGRRQLDQVSLNLGARPVENRCYRLSGRRGETHQHQGNGDAKVADGV